MIYKYKIIQLLDTNKIQNYVIYTSIIKNYMTILVLWENSIDIFFVKQMQYCMVLEKQWRLSNANCFSDFLRLGYYPNNQTANNEPQSIVDKQQSLTIGYS